MTVRVIMKEFYSSPTIPPLLIVVLLLLLLLRRLRQPRQLGLAKESKDKFSTMFKSLTVRNCNLVAKYGQF